MQNYGKLYRFLMIAMMMLTSGMAWADNWPSSTLSTGTYTLTTVGTNQFAVNGEGSYDNMAGFTINDSNKSITIVFNTTEPVTLIGQIKVQKGNLTMSLGSGYKSSVTLKNGYFGTAYQFQGLIFLPDGSNGDALTTRTITISGRPGNDPTSTSFVANNQFVIDGGCEGMQPHQAESSGYYYITCANASQRTGNPIFRVQSGTLNLTNVTIQNQWNWGGSSAFGGITVITNKNDNINYSVALNMTQCWITKCAGNGYPGVSFQYTIKQCTTDPAPKATINQCKFSDCYSTTNNTTIDNSGQLPESAENGAWINNNAAIRSVSHSKCNLEVTNCLVENNYGGGIRWQSVGANPMLVQNCTIQNNWTPSEGGGMLIKAGADIKNCQILNNTALKAGGGIFYTTFEETGSSTIYDELAPRDAIVTLDNTTQIEGNHAGTDGGGIAIYARKIHPRNKLYYYSFNEAGHETTNPLQVELRLEGATIEDNTAGGNGGGVYISRSGNASFYPTTCNLLHGNIYNNSAGSNGGGTYIGQTEEPSGTSEIHPVQPITVRTGESTANMIIDENTAGQSGGGVYVYIPHSENQSLQVPTTVELLTDTYLINNEATAGNGGGVYVEEGDVRIKASMIGVDANGNSAPNNAKAGSGGGIYTNKGNIFVNYWDPTGGNNYKLRGETKATTIKNNIAQINGGGVNTHEGKVVMRGQSYNQPIVISNNEATTGSGGGIFCMGNTANSAYEYVRLISVNLTNNEAKDGGGNAGTNVTAGCGGGLYLQSGEINITKCRLQSNTAKLNGGGINNHSGSINVKGCTIGGLTSNNATAGNTASTGSGGGIFTIHGDVNITNHHESNASYFSEITYNTAKNNGGGITTRQGKVVATGDYSDDRSKCIKINNNSVDAGSGGGVFCLGDVSGTEDKYINFTHVDVIGNRAINGTGTSQVQLENGSQVTVTNGCGGGIYLQHGVIDIFNNNIQANLANKDGGGVYNHSGRIDVDGCLIGGESAEGNTAARNGGGIYTHEGDIDIEDLIFQPGNTLVRLESKVRYNTAAENGGGINTHKGTITINNKQLDDQIEISRNTANKGGGIYANEGTIIAYNAAIRNNTAKENGGGINNHSGNIDLYGGLLSNNTAEKGNGGGAYTHVGDINIKPFNPGNQKPWLELSLNDGTRIYNNIANNNGGGLNNHTGLIDLHYATLQNNTSTLGNGGGIYCEGPHAATTGFTIRLLRSMVNQNKTRGQDGTETAPTGRGGGIYLQYGRIFAQGSTLTFNKANINGGGINNHQGNIRAYGCQISNNVATTGRGGGIYANQGLIVVGPSGVAGASVIENNSAGINGGGINNHEGDIQINGDIIQNNTAGEKGGGIYLALGNITMNGGKIDYNSAGEKGGGVYIGGTKDGGQGFLIQERQPSVPVVEIIDVEDLGTDVVTIHYHIVDDGNDGNYNVASHGVEVKYIVNGVETAIPTSIATTTTTNVADGDVPGCRRKTIQFTAAQGIELTDYVFSARAHAEYTPSGTATPLRGESSPVSFQLYGTNPVVVTGTVSGITASSASASGRLFYKGDSNVQENGIGIQYSLNANMSGATPVPYSSATTVFPAGGFYTMNINLPAPVNPYNQEEQPELYNAFNPDYVQQTFYYRAYATNANGKTGYGEIAQFTTPKNTPNMGDQEVKYEFVTVNGVPSIKFSYLMPSMTGITNYGFVLSYDDDPALKEDYTIDASIDPNNPNKFTKTVPLSIFYEGEHYPSFYYYVRAFATGSQDEAGTTPEMDVTNYSITAATKFVIPDPDGKPQIRLTHISYITQESAQITGKIFNIGGSDITRYGVCWTDDTGHLTPTVEHADDVEDTHCHLVDGEMEDLQILLQNDSVFTITMSPLTLNTTYYLRAYAKNSTGDNPEYAYSNEYNFTTLPANPPVVRLQVNNIQNNQATIHCTIDNGGKPVSEYGIYWKEATATSFTQIQHIVGSGATAPSYFDETLANLQSDKEYKVYAYAINEVGTYTGREVSFTTTYTKPSVSDPEYVAVSYDPVTRAQCIQVKGKVTATGDYSPVQKLGVLYSTFPVPQPTLFNGSDEWNWGYVEQTTPTLNEEYTFNLTGVNVQPNKYYYVRTYATSKASPTENDYQYSTGSNFTDPNYPQITFETYRFLTLPEVVSLSADPANFTATMTARINCADEDNHLVKRGFCWGENPNPVKGTNNFVEENTTPNATTAQTYSLTAEGLASNKDYYWRAYVINRNENNGTEPYDIAYSADGTFRTQGEFVITAEPLAYNAGTVNGSGYFRGYYSSVDEVTLTAEVNNTSYYEFGKWVKAVNGEETDASTEATYTFTPSQTAHYKALFKAQINLGYLNSNVGTITVAVDGGNFVDGDKYLYGTSITMTATPTPNSGYVFGYWTKNGEVIEDAGATYTFTVEDAATYSAYFYYGRNLPEEPRQGASQHGPYPRDIYPAPAREPWDWEDDLLDCQAPLAMTETTDTIVPTKATTTAPVNKPSINNNSAEYGGGVYVEHNEENPAKIVFDGGSNTAGTINYNYASEAGGGVYISRGAAMQMKGHCEVNANWVPAGKFGGGIYLDGRLYVGNSKGDGHNAHALKVNRNFAIDVTNISEITTLYEAPTLLPAQKKQRNNVFLPRNDYDFTRAGGSANDDESTVITLLSNISGEDISKTTSTNIGFSVNKGFSPVIATAESFGGDYVNYYSSGSTVNTDFTDTYEKWLTKLMPAPNGALTDNSAIFEDSETYIAIHTTEDLSPFRAKYIYLWGSWTNPAVDEDPETNNPMAGTGSGGEWLGHYKITNPSDNVANNNNPLHWEIYSEEGLSWFSSYVNGLNAFTNGDTQSGGKHLKWNADKNPYATATLMADLDMTKYFWVPIGSVSSFSGSPGSNLENAIYQDDDTHHYKGTFNGNGHIINGLDCHYLTGIKKLGLFGNLEGATVKNVFVDNSHFTTDKADVNYYVGGISGKMTGAAVVSNSEARAVLDVTVAQKTGSHVGGIVGQMKGTAEVHSSMAMPEIKGVVDYMGGLVGTVGSTNNLFNSFANPKFPNATTSPYYVINENKYIGGLVGENNGTIANCYTRLQGDEPTSNGTTSVFAWFAGTNGATIDYCYAPRVNGDNYANFKYVGTGTGTLSHQENYGLTQRVSGKYGFKHRDQQLTTNNSNTNVVNNEFLGGLLPTLNKWVETANTPATPNPGSKEGEPTSEPKYSTWTRTMASPINDDYPIIQIDDFNSVGSKDGIFMVYEDDINDMWAKNGKDFKACNTAGSNAAMYLYDAQPETVTITNNDNVRLYIHEDVGITQSQNSELHARVGVTIKNKANADAPNWHLFSSSINGVPMGIRYRTAEDETIMNINIDGYGSGTYKQLIVDKTPSGQTGPYHPESVWGNRAYFDPPKTEWYQSDDASQTATYVPNKVGYFPTNTPYGTWRSTPSTEFFDLYAYSEEFYHWVNFKREGSSTISDHWHMDRDEDSNHWRLNYGYRDEKGNPTLGNEPTLLNGKGYLLDLSSESMLMADGTLNTGNVSTWTTNTPVGTYSPTGNGYDAPWREINLIGNPYQSFLDFQKFAKANMPANAGEHDWESVFYATRDDNSTTSRNGYIYYVATQSENKPEYTASRYIHPHQGFFVKVTGNCALTFTDDMRVAGTSTDQNINSPYRDRLNYPLVNLLCYDDNGDCDLTIVEVNRPRFGGGQKMKKLHSSNGMIYARLEDRDFQVLFTPMGTNTVPVRFEAAENGHFTLRWNTLHGDFSYLHLIDNITGMDIDCLTTDEYKFEGKTTDYKSRFKLVFDCTGIDEPEDPEPDDGSTVFAFQMGNELIVNGEGMLQMFDLNGRCLMTKQAVGQQSSVSLPQVAAGMYLLRLTSNKQVRVQKMIIK